MAAALRPVAGALGPLVGSLGDALQEVAPLLAPMSGKRLVLLDRAGNHHTALKIPLSRARWLSDSIEDVLGWVLLVVLTLWILAISWVSCVNRQGDSIYEPISVSSVIEGRRKRDWKQYLNYLLFVPLHLLRSLQIPIAASGKKASSTECQFLHEKRQVFNEKVIEFLVIRRSMIFVAALFSVLTVGISVREFSKQVAAREEWEAKAHLEGADGEVMRFEEFLLSSDNPEASLQDPQMWMEYSRMLFDGMLAKLLVQTALVDLIGASIMVVCTMVSSVLLWISLKRWSRFWASSLLIRMTWAGIMLAPFIITIIPVRLLIDWSAMTPVTDAYIQELSHHLGEEAYAKAKQAVDSCYQLVDMHDEGLSSKITAKMERLCSVVGGTPDSHVQCCGVVDVLDIDFRPLHQTCRHIRQYLDSPSGPQHDLAVNMSASLCKDYVIPIGAKHLQFGLGENLENLATLTPLAVKLTTGVELAFALQNGVKGMKYILPAALAMAPAMLRGAMKVKVLAPQSTIPGMFVLILPWLFCPLSWAVYHTFYQLLCNPFMLLGLLMVAFFPMWFFVIGKYHNLTKPLTDAKVESLIRSIGPVAIATNIVGWAFIVSLIVFNMNSTRRKASNRRSLEDDIWEILIEKLKVFRWYNLLELIGNAFAKFTLTTLCGIDWMLTEIGQQRRFETLLVISEKLAELEEETNYPRELRSSVERQEFQKVSAERQNRLDCVEWILYNEVPLRVEDKELEDQIRRKSRLSSLLTGQGKDTASFRRKQLRPAVDIATPEPEESPTPGIELASVSRFKEWRSPTRGQTSTASTDEPSVEGQESDLMVMSKTSRLRSNLLEIQQRLTMADPMREIRRAERRPTNPGDDISNFLTRWDDEDADDVEKGDSLSRLPSQDGGFGARRNVRAAAAAGEEKEAADSSQPREAAPAWTSAPSGSSTSSAAAPPHGLQAHGRAAQAAHPSTSGYGASQGGFPSSGSRPPLPGLPPPGNAGDPWLQSDSIPCDRWASAAMGGSVGPASGRTPYPHAPTNGWAASGAPQQQLGGYPAGGQQGWPGYGAPQNGWGGGHPGGYPDRGGMAPPRWGPQGPPGSPRR